MFLIQSAFNVRRMIFFLYLRRICASSVVIFVGFLSTALTAQTDSNYELGVGDTIKINVFEEPDMSFEVSVDNEGVLTFPYLDEIVIKGKTTAELEQILVDGLKGRVLVNPSITVSVVQYRPFSIGGEVRNPGNYPYEPNLTIQKAINLAGGVTEWANGKRFSIERSESVNTKESGLDTAVNPGDVVTILPRRF